MKKILFLFFLSLIIAAQENNFNDLMNYSLEELLNMDVTVATKSSLTPRETPGIISVITQEDIKKSGANDLVEILRLVPGFEYGADVEGAFSIGIRGNWAHEGKISLYIDGFEVNELNYSNLVINDRILLENIEKIEIIRGPGSAIYGGNSELGVINIVTKSGKSLNGGFLKTYLSAGDKGFYNRNVQFSVGSALGESEVALHTAIGKSIQSDKDYTDFYGVKYNMRKNSNIYPLYLNFNYKYKDFSFRYIWDKLLLEQKDQVIDAIPSNIKPTPTDFNYSYIEMKYDWNLVDNFKLTPRFYYKKHNAWAVSDAYVSETGLPDSVYYSKYFNSDFTSERYAATLLANYDYSKELNILFGAEELWDRGTSNNHKSLFQTQEKYRVKYDQYAIYTQLLYKHSIANLTLGLRYDKHSEGWSSFIPRFAITKVIDDFHFKLLYSNAFRSPGIRNIDLQLTKLDPEKTTVIETELGYVLNKNMIFTINLFDIKIKDPIIYVVTSNGEGYKNLTKMGTQGVEFQYLYKEKFGKFELNYSYYKNNKNEVADYVVPTNKDVNLAFPQHKVNLITSYNISNNLSINANMTYLSDRYKFTPGGYEKEKSLVLLNANVLYVNFNNLDIQLGIKNILDADYNYIQAYNAKHMPLPSKGREYFLSVVYNF
ncbi:MAG TPA: TonB-dependent receptor plug domain-containing protein [Ignavibacteriales bacterium]|nr:TonB-dependent receptor plug domain-containing protein [Ignavibacteriales bacterium]